MAASSSTVLTAAGGAADGSPEQPPPPPSSPAQTPPHPPPRRDGSSSSSRPEPLSFKLWFARGAYASDLLLLVAEPLLLGTPHLASVMFERMCVPLGGSPHAALQELPLDPGSARHAGLAAFPCGASYPQRLLYTLRTTTAAMDPRASLRLSDFAYGFQVAAHVLTLGVALTAPRLYERARHGLFIATCLATVLGLYASVVWTPDGLLPLVGASMIGRGRRMVGAAYFTWKAAMVLRLFVGPIVWLLVVAAMPAVDRRLQPTGAPQPSQHPSLSQALFLFVILAVLPYVMDYAWESVSLWPQYHAYLRSIGGSEAAAEPPLVTRGASERPPTPEPARPPLLGPARPRMSPIHPPPAVHGGPDSPLERIPAHRDPPGPLQGAQLQRPGAAGAGGQPERGVAGPPPLHLAPSYRPPVPHGGGVSRQDFLLSIKVPLARHAELREASTVAMGAAVAALHPFLHDGTAGLSPAATSGGARGGAGVGTARDNGGGSRGDGQASPKWPRRQLLSATWAVCVEGSVHLLLTMCWGGGGEPDRPPDRRTSVHHARLEYALAGAGSVDVPAMTAAIQQLLAEAVLGDSPLEVPRPGALIWPPAVGLVEAGAAEQQGGDGGAEGSSGLPSRGAGGTEVLVLVPAALLRGQGDVRCVVAGPTGQQQRLEVHLDATVDVAGLQRRVAAEPGDEAEAQHEDFVALRQVGVVVLPPAATRVAGSVMLYLLPATVEAPLPPPQPGPPATEAAAGEGTAAAEGGLSPPPPPVLVPTAAPIAALPLLLMSPAAAEEVQRMYRQLLEPDTCDVLQQLMHTAAAAADVGQAAPAAPVTGCFVGGFGSGHPSDGHAVSEASAAIAASGLTGLVFDMGILLQLPYGCAHAVMTTAGARPSDEAEAGVAASGEAAPPVPPLELPAQEVTFIRHVLRFLASHGMGACLRESLRALRRTGLQLHLEEEEEEGAGVEEQQQRAAEAPSAVAAPAADAPATAKEMRAAAAAATAAAPPRQAKSGVEGAAMAGVRPPFLPPLVPAGPLWWLRVLLLGFAPSARERSYQAFKGVQCRSLDCMALVLLAAVRLFSLARTLNAAAADVDAAPAISGLGAGWLTSLQQQVIAQTIFLGFGLAVLALAFGHGMLQSRHRTNLFLLKALLDAASYLLLLWPQAWCGRRHPPLAMPGVWVAVSHDRGLLYFQSSMWEPATLQLWVVLISLLPATLLAYHVHYGRWAPALAFGACNALSGMVVSAATDLLTRRVFLRQPGGKNERSSVAAGGRNNTR
ncbi:hypothetical protein TSOC_003227 [Tetrabaena socialis]|uniref:Uncharacterized protein n=1 Tax=Tetrabaena socialis TaxID=47790 RepID=A0A2J8AC63_9CHLO|nr:hypothetical protein TSOC_003227 [Tetrabaena socialis]|eukprot:PNH10105.1 hypothetical protein TSOC_003227 [Tetrabaena socialis]